MPDLELRHWIVLGTLFWVILAAGVLVGTLLGPRDLPLVRRDPRYGCLCPDSIPVAGPRTLRTERN